MPCTSFVCAAISNGSGNVCWFLWVTSGSRDAVNGGFLAHFADLRDRLASVTSNVELQRLVMTSIDVELIKQMVDNEAFDVEEVARLTTTVVSLIASLQSPVDKAEYTEWYERVFKERLSRCATLNDALPLIPPFFEVAVSRIENVQVGVRHCGLGVRVFYLSRCTECCTLLCCIYSLLPRASVVCICLQMVNYYLQMLVPFAQRKGPDLLLQSVLGQLTDLTRTHGSGDDSEEAKFKAFMPSTHSFLCAQLKKSHDSASAVPPRNIDAGEGGLCPDLIVFVEEHCGVASLAVTDIGNKAVVDRALAVRAFCVLLQAPVDLASSMVRETVRVLVRPSGE